MPDRPPQRLEHPCAAAADVFTVAPGEHRSTHATVAHQRLPQARSGRDDLAATRGGEPVRGAASVPAMTRDAAPVAHGWTRNEPRDRWRPGTAASAPPPGRERVARHMAPAVAGSSPGPA